MYDMQQLCSRSPCAAAIYRWVTSRCSLNRHLQASFPVPGLLLGTEACVMTPNGIDLSFSFLFLSFSAGIYSYSSTPDDSACPCNRWQVTRSASRSILLCSLTTRHPPPCLCCSIFSRGSHTCWACVATVWSARSLTAMAIWFCRHQPLAKLLCMTLPCSGKAQAVQCKLLAAACT